MYHNNVIKSLTKDAEVWLCQPLDVKNVKSM